MKFLAALTAVFSLTLHAQQAPSEVSVLTNKFHQTMMVCPQKIWADFSWQGLQVVMAYPSKTESWIWDASTNVAQPVTNSALPSQALGSSYAFFEFNGKPTMSLNMEKQDEPPFGVGIHEMFHYQGQKDWETPGGSRSTDYPIQWEPRFYRRMLYDNLKKYFENGQPENLSRARFWYDKWVTEYTAEVMSTTDGYEGTAQYVEILAIALMETNCAATEAQLKAQVTNGKSYKALDMMLSSEGLALDGEGYSVGSVSSLILRFQNHDLLDFKLRSMQGETPLQILMDGVSALEEAAPADLRQTFENAGADRNIKLGVLVDKDIANWTNPSYVRVSPKDEWLQSNFVILYFVNATEIQKNLAVLYGDHQYLSPDKRSDLIVQKKSVMFFDDKNICNNKNGTFLVPAASIELINGVANISSANVKGKLVGQIKADAEGFQYLCVD